MKKLLPFLLLLSGCGTMNRLRGHNILMAYDAVTAVEKKYDEVFDEKVKQAETPEEKLEVERERANAKYDIEDAKDRLRMGLRDFPPPKVDKEKGEEPVVRHTPETPSEEDRHLRDAYNYGVNKRETRRAAWQWFKDRMKELGKGVGSVFRWIFYGVICVVILIVIVVVAVIYRKIRWLYRFLSDLLDAALGDDKEAKRKLAEGTPVGDAHRKKKAEARKNGKS